jgi:hypothetical protein
MNANACSDHEAVGDTLIWEEIPFLAKRIQSHISLKKIRTRQRTVIP